MAATKSAHLVGHNLRNWTLARLEEIDFQVQGWHAGGAARLEDTISISVAAEIVRKFAPYFFLSLSLLGHFSTPMSIIRLQHASLASLPARRQKTFPSWRTNC